MPTIDYSSFKDKIIEIYKQKAEDSERQDLLIPLVSDLYTKQTTISFLKEANINPTTIKKIVSLNAAGKLVVDNGISSNVFVSNDGLAENERDLLQKDQLLFVKDASDNSKIKVYKIAFNESADEVAPELVKLNDILLTDYNDLFINSGLFKAESNTIGSVFEAVTNEKHNLKNSDGDSNENIVNDLVNDLKAKLALNAESVADDYFIYRQDNKVVIKGIKNANYQEEVTLVNNSFLAENDILYITKNSAENNWNTYKIKKTSSWDSLFRTYYQAHKCGDLSEEQFISNVKTLAIFAQPNDEKEGFTHSEDANSLAQSMKTEKNIIISNGIDILTKSADSIPLATIALNNNDHVAIKAALSIADNDFLYSLVVDNDHLNLIDVSSNSEKTILREKILDANKEKWDAVTDKYDRVYLTKDPENDHSVKQWVVTTNNDQHQLQCIGTSPLTKLRTDFANNNLFYVLDESYNNISLGQNQAEIMAKNAQNMEENLLSLSTKSPPPVIYNIINLKWNEDKKWWNLNVTTSEQTLNKEIILAENESKVLNTLLAKNNNATTVILFNKYDGSFLRAYYLDENNRKVNCSNKLSDADKEQLVGINNKAKVRVKEVTIVKPQVYKDPKTFTKDLKFFRLFFTNGKWWVWGKDQVNKQTKAVMSSLTSAEISALSYLVKDAIEVKVYFDSSNKFKKLNYVDIEKQAETVTVNSENLPSSNTFNGEEIDTIKLMEKIFDIIKHKTNLIPEDNGVTWKPWNKEMLKDINETLATDNTTPRPENYSTM